MTVQATEPLYSDVYVSSGVELDFPFPFSAFRDSDVGVAIRAPGAESWTPLDYGADYTVSRNPAPVIGGTVHLPAPLAAGSQLIAYANIEFSQDRKFENQSGLFLFEIEASLDKLTAMAKLLADDAERAPRTDRFTGGRGLIMPEPSPGRVLIGRPDGAGWTDGPTDTEIANAETYSNEAKAARDKARQWADDPEDSPVEPGLFSARHHAAKAHADAIQSATSAAEAALYEGPWLDTVAALLADTTLTYGPGASGVIAGDIVRTRAEGFAYRVIADSDPDYDFATAGGVRLYLLPSDAGHYNFAGMAPAADGVTDDYPKLKRLLDRVVAPGSSASYSTGATIFVPVGRYFIGQTINLKRTTNLIGENSGVIDPPTGSDFVFPPDTIGLIVNRYNTIDDTVEAPATTGADGSIIEGIRFLGSKGSLVRRDRHGIWLRARAIIRNCNTSGFAGDGVHIRADAGSGGSLEGNANNWQIDTLRSSGNAGNGVYVFGGDANAGYAANVDASTNGRCGIYDYSFLGNTWVACHVAGNGTGGRGGNTAEQSSIVSYGGRRYAAHWLATEAQLVATTPGTDATVWVDQEVGGAGNGIPLWQSGMPEGSYFQAYAYRGRNNNARNLFLNCYAEGGAAGSVFEGTTTLAVGGMIERVLTGMRLAAASGAVRAPAIGANYGNVGAASLGGLDTFLSFSTSEDDGNGYYSTQFRSGDYVVRHRGAANRQPFKLNGTLTAGRAPYLLGFSAVDFGGRYLTRIAGNSPPTSGAVLRGDVWIYTTPSASGKIGCACVTGGDIGTTAVLKEFGAIDA